MDQKENVTSPQTTVPESCHLEGCSEDKRREFAIALMEKYVPSQLGEAAFATVTQGRAEQAAKMQKFFSTCGELAMLLLHHLGYRGQLLNRTLLLERDGEARGYVYGQNMTYLYKRGLQQGNFVRFTGENRPKPGDICYVVEPDGTREHVFVFRGIEGDKWLSYDGGQIFGPNAWDQCAKLRERTLKGKKLDTRVLVGWVDISTLKLTKEARLAL